MELWIRSQDKEALRRINTSLYLKFGLSNYAEGDVWFIVTGGDNLGEYKTKERSLEVLDEIQELLKPKTMLTKIGNVIGETCDGTVYSEPNEYDIKELSICVYEMPEE